MRAHWRNLANTSEPVLPSVHPSPQPKRQIDHFSHFCTAQGRVLPGMPWHVLSTNNCPFARRSGPYLIRNIVPWAPPEPITQTASRSIQPFLHRSRQSVAILYNGTLLPPSKLSLPMGSGPHLIYGSLDPPEFSTQTECRLVQPFFAGLTSVADRHTTRSVTIGRIYIRSTAMRPLIIHNWIKLCR